VQFSAVAAVIIIIIKKKHLNIGTFLFFFLNCESILE
jgi:hypothetical protein